MSFVQTVSQAIGTIRVYLSTLPTRGGVYALEVFDGETAVPGAVTTLTARPNEDVSGTGASPAWRQTDNVTTTIYTEIDEATLNVGDGIWCGETAAATYTYVARFDTALLALTGLRILAVRLYARTGLTGGSTAYLQLNIGGVAVGAQGVFGGGDSSASVTYPYNPSTNAPWTIADVQALDTTGGVNIVGTTGVNANVLVYQLYLEVVTCPENRIAVGTLNDSASALTADAWNAATMLTPTGGVWTKDATGRHLYVVRRLTSTGAINVPTLGAAGLGGAPSASNWTVTADPTYGYVTAMGAAGGGTFGLIQRTTAPAESVDSQPYALQVTGLVYTSQDAEQEFSSAAVADYGQFQALINYAGTPTDSLLIKLKRRSDNVQFGTTVTVTKAMADAITTLGTGWKSLIVSAATFGTLAAATQYYIEFSSSTDAANPWHVLALDTADQGNGATFGGTTDRAVVNGTEADRYDIPATVSSVPTAPAALTVTESVQTLSAATDAGCDVETLEYLALNWNDTALAADFSYYEVQRSEDGGVAWFTIARISDAESNSDYADYDARTNDTAFYRVRVARLSDGATSAWTSIAGGTITATKCELRLVSNVDPSLNVAYQWTPQRDYQFPNAESVITHDIYQRDGAVAFFPTEDRLTVFSTPLTVNVGKVPAQRGVSVFDPLQALERAQGNTIPYVSVCDHLGNRWFAAVIFPHGTERQRPGELCVAEVTIRELTRTPFIHEVE